MRRIAHLINHWTVTSAYSTVEELRQMHKAKGWRDIGYHRVILHPNSKEFNGVVPVKWWELVKQGRDLDQDLYIEQNEVGAHTLYYNENSVGIVVVGHPSYKMDPLQREALIMTNLTFGHRFKLNLRDTINGKPVLGGHRDFNATQCPGDEVYEIIEGLRKVA